jgi:hypothetical protein
MRSRGCSLDASPRRPSATEMSARSAIALRCGHRAKITGSISSHPADAVRPGLQRQSAGRERATSTRPSRHRRRGPCYWHVPRNTSSYANNSKRKLCKNCVRWARNQRRTPTITASHGRTISGGKSLMGMRERVFQYHSVSVSRVAFQACSIDHSDISPFKINDLRAV